MLELFWEERMHVSIEIIAWKRVGDKLAGGKRQD